MEHRGSSTDGVSGDGAGILLRVPHAFLSKVVKEDLGVALPNVSP